MPIRLIQHEASFEVRFPNGAAKYFYFDENESRRAVTGRMTKESALEAAKDYARAEREKIGKVWVYNAGRNDMKVFATQDAAHAWFAENDPEGVAFAHEVIGEPDSQ